MSNLEKVYFFSQDGFIATVELNHHDQLHKFLGEYMNTVDRDTPMHKNCMEILRCKCSNLQVNFFAYGYDYYILYNAFAHLSQEKNPAFPKDSLFPIFGNLLVIEKMLFESLFQ